MLFTESGKVSKTMVVGWLQILSALLLASAEFVKNGDFSTYAVILLVNGIVMVFLRNLTVEAMA